MNKNLLLFFIFLLAAATSCNGLLDEEVYSELGSSNFYSSSEDAESLLNSAYSLAQGYDNLARNSLCLNEVSTGIFMEREGGIYTYFKPMEEFTWDAAHSYLYDVWVRWYEGIYYANTVIDNVPSIDMDEDRKTQIVAEARFLRVLYYTWLYDFWGPVPLILTSNTTPQDRPARAEQDEFIDFVENEFLELVEILPLEQDEYPRATKGAAQGFLTRFYMNNHEWELAAASASTVMDYGIYDLFEGTESRAELFNVDNEGDNEFIFVAPFSSQSPANSYNSHAVPDNYQWTYSALSNYAADFLIPSSFIETFDPADQRLDAFIFKYLSTSGDSIELGEDQVVSFKFPEDPNQVGSYTSIDFPLLRYADILLLRSEALNEINGPNQESIDLINEVRRVAGLSGLDLNGYTQQTLRDAIMDERGWEFHTEGLRRTDLIRQGRFVSDAIARGWAAQDYQVLYPIPSAEISVNPNLTQNEGY